MQKLDMKKAERDLYDAPRDRATLVDVPAESFLMLDGRGSPSTGGAFQEAIGALYSVAYSLKFALKRKDKKLDHDVMPLEALWWWEDPRKRFHEAADHEWRWTLMIRVPSFATGQDVAEAIEDAKLKTPLAGSVRFETFREGRAMQIMHVGPYKGEWPTIQTLHAQMRHQGYVMNGKHHEIYLGDPRRAKPDELKTILRQPVRWTDEGNE